MSQEHWLHMQHHDSPLIRSTGQSNMHAQVFVNMVSLAGQLASRTQSRERLEAYTTTGR